MPNTCLCRSLGRSLCPVHPNVKPAAAAPTPAAPKAPAPKPEPKKAEPKKAEPKPEPKKKPEPAPAPVAAAEENGSEYYTFEELDKLTKRQLLKIANENKISVPRKASKAEMISLLMGE